MLSQLVQLAGRLAVAAVTVTAPIQPTAATIPFRIVAQGADSRIAAHRELIIRAPGVWDFVWRKHAESAPPDIDFRRETIVAIFGGRQAPATGALRVTGITEEDGSIVVRYRQEHDRSRSEPSEAQTPFVIVAIPPQRAPMKFIMAREATD
jgi:hypothetical protein